MEFGGRFLRFVLTFLLHYILAPHSIDLADKLCVFTLEPLQVLLGQILVILELVGVFLDLLPQLAHLLHDILLGNVGHLDLNFLTGIPNEEHIGRSGSSRLLGLELLGTHLRSKPSVRQGLVTGPGSALVILESDTLEIPLVPQLVLFSLLKVRLTLLLTHLSPLLSKNGGLLDYSDFRFLLLHCLTPLKIHNFAAKL